MKNFTINGVTYKAHDFDFNTICDIEDMGVPMSDVTKKPMMFARAYLAICAGITKEEAGTQILLHTVGGGNLDGLMTAMSESLEESDFFRALQERADKEVTETPSKKKS